jgi:hypothetical protein
MNSRPKPVTDQEPSRREPRKSGVNIRTIVDEPEPDDPFAEFHDGWEPVRRRKSQAPPE